MSGISILRRMECAENLLHRALFELRDRLENGIEGNCFLTSNKENAIPAKIPENRDAIEAEQELITLVREVEAFQSEAICTFNVPWEGPRWLDEVIAQGPDWAEEAA